MEADRWERFCAWARRNVSLKPIDTEEDLAVLNAAADYWVRNIEKKHGEA